MRWRNNLYYSEPRKDTEPGCEALDKKFQGGIVAAKHEDTGNGKA